MHCSRSLGWMTHSAKYWLFSSPQACVIEERLPKGPNLCFAPCYSKAYKLDPMLCAQTEFARLLPACLWPYLVSLRRLASLAFTWSLTCNDVCNACYCRYVSGFSLWQVLASYRSEIMKAFFQHFFLPISTIVFHRAACSSAQVPWLFSLRQIMFIVCISWKEPVLQDYHVVRDDHEQRIQVVKICANIECCQIYNF